MQFLHHRYWIENDFIRHDVYVSECVYPEIVMYIFFERLLFFSQCVGCSFYYGIVNQRCDLRFQKHNTLLSLAADIVLCYSKGSGLFQQLNECRLLYRLVAINDRNRIATNAMKWNRTSLYRASFSWRINYYWIA